MVPQASPPLIDSIQPVAKMNPSLVPISSVHRSRFEQGAGDLLLADDASRLDGGSGQNGNGVIVSRSIIERHNGRFWATPNDGPGTTFSFSVPCEPEGLAGRHLPMKTEAAAVEIRSQHHQIAEDVAEAPSRISSAVERDPKCFRYVPLRLNASLVCS